MTVNHPNDWDNPTSRRVIVFSALSFVVVYSWLLPSSVLIAVVPGVLYAMYAIIMPFFLEPLWYELPLEYWDEMYVNKYKIPARHAPHLKGSFEAYPPAFANGWYNVMPGHLLAPGGVESIRVLARDFVLFRGEDGMPGMMNAYCSHLGANLGVGGVVKGNCIECPFHGWQFDATGKCQSIPGVDGAIPKGAHKHSELIVESHGIIWWWFDVEGRSPSYTLDDAYPEEKIKGWKYQGNARHYISCHQSEVPENGSDVAHLNHLHESSRVTVGGALSYLFNITHYWTANWRVSQKNSAWADIDLTEIMRSYGTDVPLSWQNAEIVQVGPSIVILTLTGAYGRVCLVHALTSIEPFVQRLDTMLFAEPTLWSFRALGKFILKGYAGQFERDVLLWNRKRYTKKPVLVKPDGPIGKFRRWYSQFYSDNSPTCDQVLKNEYDW